MQTHRVLVAGSGGREHALAWALARSPHVEKVYIAPGNAGTARVGENVAIPVDDITGLVNFARLENITLTVIGPEVPLAAGIVDAFQAVGLNIFGPTQAAARLESSKVFAREFMDEVGIPGSEYATFDDVDAAYQFIDVFGRPVVVKADGLAAGKGVIICDNREEAREAVKTIMVKQAFGDAGKQVVIEERLEGREVSVLAFTDGETVVPMPLARDHKRAYDNDEGPNTGGMGAFAPTYDVSPEQLDDIMEKIMLPTVRGMAALGTPYRGVLYAGLMLTRSGARVLEFNCRFGDPETQVVLPLLETDFFEVCMACVEGQLDEVSIEWAIDASCATVVLASPGYPQAYPTGLPITGLDNVPDDLLIFHAGTSVENEQIVTSGGRVIAVTARATELDSALNKVYEAIPAIQFEKMHYRRDIGRTVIDNSAYGRAGVSIEAGRRTVNYMKTAVKSSYDERVLSDVGSFGGLFDASALRDMKQPVLVASTDGVGTKTKVAARMRRWDSVGRDLVNHCINDILVQGAHPLFFMDYVAARKIYPEQMATIVRGIAVACRDAGIPLLGGEMAEMPGVYKKGELDIAGTIIGAVERDAVITGEDIQIGDVVLGLASSGLHTNGFTLARSVLRDMDWTLYAEELGRSIGEALLEVHRSYLEPVNALRGADIPIKGMAHITGGGVIDNLPRILPENMGAVLKRGTWPELPIFGLIQRLGGVDEYEMFQVFNMGLGLLLVVDSEHVESVRQITPEDVYIVGEIVSGDEVQIQNEAD